jgi:SAM-dependent methyltransferase
VTADESHRRLAQSFGETAAAYERGRPGWPLEAVDAVGLPPDAEVLDLAAGTGKLTRVLERRFARVVAVEPDGAMRALNPAAIDGSAESIPLADAIVDGVFCAEAFHWFDRADVVAEIARVLRPGGTVALLWNVPLSHLVPDDVWGSPGGSAKQNRFETGEWRAAFDGGRFGPFEQASFEHEQLLTRELLVDYYASISWVASLPAERREREIGRFAGLLDGSEYRRMLRAEVYWARLA